jgi:hypothetical protein
MPNPTCPECGDRLKIDEEWQITDRSLIGTEDTGDLQGVYAHARCVGGRTGAMTS